MIKRLILISFIIVNSNLICSEIGTPGEKIIGDKGIYQSNAEIMQGKNIKIKNKGKLQLYVKIRKLLTKNFRNQSKFPSFSKKDYKPYDKKDLFKLINYLKFDIKRSPQKISTPNFLGATLNEDPVFPPDTMGAVGPTQFIVAINGLVRSFNKTNGKRDGVLNLDMDLFFRSIINPNIQTTFDPRIRYDKLSNRWFISCDSVDIADSRNNNILLAVSTSGVITSAASGWNFFKIIPRIPANDFFDYPTLGLDRNALYIGGTVFGPNNLDLNNICVFVVKKSSVLSDGPIIYHKFKNLFNANFSGPWLPQGVVNFNKDATVGYFISPDLINNSRFIIRKIFDPGSNSPKISGNIYIPVPFFQSPINVPHKGNTLGARGFLDGGDTRLLDSHARAGNIWTTHPVGVNNNGICPTNFSNVSRVGSRFYQISLATNPPKLIQSGTLFQSSPFNVKDKSSFIYPGIMTSGQGHMVMGCTRAGRNEFINAAASGRLRTDKLGTLGSATSYTASSTAYNVMDDPTQGFRRWGDYSYSSVDPDDNMTMWTIQEYCSSKNNWGIRAVKLLAPPPATPSSTSPILVARNQSTINLTIIGKSINGSGFYDPGGSFKKRIRATISGGVTVKRIRCISPTKLCLTVSTVGATSGTKNVTVINPDGQKRTGVGIFRVA